MITWHCRFTTDLIQAGYPWCSPFAPPEKVYLPLAAAERERALARGARQDDQGVYCHFEADELDAFHEFLLYGPARHTRADPA